MGVVIRRGGGVLITGPVVNGSVVNSRVNDLFAFILVLGGNLVLAVAGNIFACLDNKPPQLLFLYYNILQLYYCGLYFIQMNIYFIVSLNFY